MNHERLAKVTTQILAAIEYRAASDYARALSGQDDAPLITVCLGPGRCMLPASADVKICPYCSKLPEGCTKDEAADIARRFVGGM